MHDKLRYSAWKICLIFLGLFLNQAVFGQTKITGKVIGFDDKIPVIGASVKIKGSTAGTVTDLNGSFTLTVKTTDVLVISYIGYDTQEVTVGDQSAPVINLHPASRSLNEVVVTGYSSQRKKDITGAVAVVNVSNLKAVPSGSTESLLQGQASGVTVVSSGAPGSASNIKIRGITSVGSTDPLVIVDGTPGSLHDINVNDIQSIQVLKDAGSAAIYGVRGSNGVVIVTTKKGKVGVPTITYDTYYGTQRPNSKGWNLANPTETANAIWQEYKNDGLAPVHKQYGSGPEPVIPDYITPAAGKNGDPNTDPSTYALYSNQITKANKEGTDWFHEIFKPAPIQSHSLSVSGGTEKSNYLFSLGYLDQQGTLIETYLKRYSVRVNTSFKVKDHIRIGENLYAFYKQNPGYTNLPGVNSTNAINASFRMPTIIPVYDINGNYAGGGSQSLGNAPNPVAIQQRTKDYKNSDWNISGNAYAEVDFLKKFTARTSFGGTVDYFYNNAFVFTGYENAENSTNPNSYIENYGFSTNWTWTNTLNYKDTFGKHSINVLIGSEAIKNLGNAVGASRGNYYLTNPNNLTVDPNLWTLNFGESGTQTNSNIVNPNGQQTPYQLALYSLFGRFDYNYNDKYLLSGTLRRDGASVFATDKRYGLFPSVTGGWRISGEEFMKKVDWINDLKIRAGWGKLGSISNINSTNAFTLYGQGAVLSYYDINGSSNSSVQGLYISQFGNPNTSWEEDIITNIGFDATIIKNKIDMSFEVYKKSINGLLFPAALPSTAGGASAPFINSGNIENKGIDAAVTYHGSFSSDFKMDFTGTFTSYDNKVVSLPKGTAYIDVGSGGSSTTYSRLQPGHPVGAFFGYKVMGIFQNAAEVSSAATQDAAAPGRFRYQDVNGDGKIDASDRTFFGNPNPKFTTGLNIGASYKNFDFLMFLYASVGNDVLNIIRSSTDFPQQFDVAVSKDAVYNSWTPQRPNAKVPMLERSSNFSNNTAFSSYYDESGSYLRCKTVVLGYNIPALKLKKIGIEKLRVFIQGTNLFTITKYSGLDPELPGSNTSSTLFGIDGGAYPANQKTFTAGVNMSF
jgi:TonB-linked SusC/RagA family outer membrane protein